MLSTRLQKIANFLEFNDEVVDIGCDHGYLGIYATQKKLVKSIILTDIKESALDMARKNVKNTNLDIPLLVSDGLDAVDENKINTVVISGMGTSTILHILNNPNKLVNVNKLILQSNNNLDILREEVTKLGFNLVDEVTVKDNDIWYVICLFKKDRMAVLDQKTIKYGLKKQDKEEYYKYLLANQEKILARLEKSNNINLKNEKQNEIKELKELLEECRTVSSNSFNS